MFVIGFVVGVLSLSLYQSTLVQDFIKVKDGVAQFGMSTWDTWVESVRTFYNIASLHVEQEWKKTCVETEERGVYIVRYCIWGKKYQLYVKALRGPHVHAVPEIYEGNIERYLGEKSVILLKGS